LIPLGGLGEIGLNMMLVESGDDLLAVDCGLMFPDDELPGIDHVIPDFSYALARRDGFRGVLLTHGHEDHIGALPYLLREVPEPARRRDARLPALRRARRPGGPRPLLGLDERGPPGAHALGERGGPGARRALRAGGGACDRRHLRLAHPPDPARPDARRAPRP